MTTISFPRPSSKKGAPPCGLYISPPQAYQPFTFAEEVRKFCQAVNASPYEKNMHAFAYRHPSGMSVEQDFIFGLREYLKTQGIVFIVEEDVFLAERLEADGVCLRSPARTGKARKAVGDAGIVGLHAGLSKKKAEEGRDRGIDYLIFSPGRRPAATVHGMMKWWQAHSDKPCMVDAGLSNNTVKPFVRAGAGFIESSDYIWNYGKGVLQATVNMLHAIDLALEE